MIAHRSPKAFHYVNLLQEEPQQHFYNIHQNRGKHVLEWFVMYCWFSGSELWRQLHLLWKHRKGISWHLETVFCAPGSATVHRNQRPPSSLWVERIRLTSAGHHCRKTDGERPFQWKLSKRGSEPGDTQGPLHHSVHEQNSHIQYKKGTGE